MKAKKKKIIHFRDNCIGCNSCFEHAPGNWSVDPADGRACLLRSSENGGIYTAAISEPEVEVNKLAAQDCPAGIIRIEDETGKDITWS